MKQLHPDYEPDEAKKREKPEVTKRISIAYQENNLYALLKLRSEYLNESLGNNELKTYTSELNKRIRELETERYEIKSQYKDIYDNLYSSRPGEITKRIHGEQEKLEEHMRIEREQNELFSDRKTLRRYLKESILPVSGRPSDCDESLMEAFF